MRKKLPTITTPPVQLMELPSTKLLVQFREGCQLEEQLNVFLLSHIHPRRFFSQLLLPSKCLQHGQLIIKRMMMHLHIFTIIYPSLLSQPLQLLLGPQQDSIMLTSVSSIVIQRRRVERKRGRTEARKMK